MKCNCAAPDCKEKIEVSVGEYVSEMFASMFRGGSFNAMFFCPEHKERITQGKVNDGDPNTNPDLNK